MQKGEQPLKNVRVQVSDLAGPAGKIPAKPERPGLPRLVRQEQAQAQKRNWGPNEVEDVTIRPVAWHADAGVPLAEPFGRRSACPPEGNGIEDQTNQSIWVDIYVPKGDQGRRRTPAR